MKKLYFLLVGSMLLIFLSGCSTLKRFKSAQYMGIDNSLVDVALFGTQLQEEMTSVEQKNLWGLSANAQTQLIRIMHERYPDNSQFIGAINNEYSNPGYLTSPGYTTKELRMVFGISKRRDYAMLHEPAGRFSPADRIEYLKFSLEIPSSYNLMFKEWNRFVTEYGEIDLADVSFSRNLDLEAERKVNKAGVGGKLSVSSQEKQEIRSRYLKLNGSMSKHRISIEEEGTREIDLTGNVTAGVVLEFSGFPERVAFPLFSDTGTGGSSGEVAALRFVDVLVPAMEEAPDTIMARLTVEYIYRHVASGWNTFAEWDDRVEYYSGNLKKQIPLFTRKEFLPPFYCIGTGMEGKEVLKVRHNQGRTYLLQFSNYSDASRFLDWLDAWSRRQAEPGMPVFAGDQELIYQGKPLLPGQVVSDQLKVIPVFSNLISTGY